MEMFTTAERAEWRRYLAEHFETAREVWFVFPNRDAGEESLSYNDAVEEALCFGWIDSTNRRLDEHHCIRRFSPRKQGSAYSQPNIERLIWLDARGLIHPKIRDSVLPVLRKPFVFPEDILDLLRQYLLVNENCSILLTSHISSDLEGLCDDIYLIHEGRILLHEDTDTILSSYAILKISEDTYEKLDKSYILSTKKEPFGYVCFTDEKQFYAENYPGIVIENGNIDDLILMLTGGK